MYDFKDKVVVLTGGASGMGRSFVTYILARGGRVSFGDINTALSKSLLLQIHSSAPQLVSRLLFTKTDIRDATQVRALFTRTTSVFGKIDLLLCVAGVNLPDSFLPRVASPAGTSPEQANLLSLDINLSGTINTIYAGLPDLKADACIVVVSSAVGIYPSSVQPIYSASKHGLIGFSRALAPVLPQGQRILVLAPSTYLPPHQATHHGLNVSQEMEQGSNSNDPFTSIIGGTLGFIEMSTILHVLDECLAVGTNGQVVEITPLGVSEPAFPPVPERVAQMEEKLRSRICTSNANANASSRAQKVKAEGSG